MGFDLYGNKPIVPKNNKAEIKVLERKREQLKDNTDLDTADIQEKLWAIEEKIEGLSPGAYFRNNVWWWRPLWTYVCNTCSDILTEIQLDGGFVNGGTNIPKYKAIKIAKRLQEQVDNGNLKQASKEYKEQLERLPDSDCTVCGATGKRLEAPDVGPGTIHCNACDGKGKQKNWAVHYPFDIDNVKDFIIFAKYSGGFKIY